MKTHPTPTDLKPPLKWAGGKRWLAPHMKPIWARYQQYCPDGRYVEPFVGGLALPLHLRPKFALLNDQNIHLIDFYHWVQRGETVDIEMRNDRDLYYQHRETFNRRARERHAIDGHTGDRPPDRETAQLFYYLNRTGYNGLCRFNRKGEFNVPFGRYKTVHYEPTFANYAPVLRQWDFRYGDFESVPLQEGDFVYADPPYDVEFTSYSRTPFTFEDQKRLVNWLAKHKGVVVLSNQATPRICELYESAGFELNILPAPRRISCNGDRRPALEVFAIKETWRQ